MALGTPISGTPMRLRRLMPVLALVAAGCGGGGEAHPDGDGSPPRDTAPDIAADPRGAGGAAGRDGIDAPVTAGGEIAASCTVAGDCKSGFCFDGVCCRSDCSGLCQSCAQPGGVGT